MSFFCFVLFCFVLFFLLLLLPAKSQVGTRRPDVHRGDAKKKKKSPFNHKLHLLFIIPVVAFLCVLFHVHDGTAHRAPETSKLLDVGGGSLASADRRRRRREGVRRRWRVTKDISPKFNPKLLNSVLVCSPRC